MKKPFQAIGPPIIFGALLLSGAALAASFRFVAPLKGLSVARMVESAPVGATTIDCGRYHCYALVDGSVWSVGSNRFGHLGREGTTDQSTWGDTNLAGVSDIAAGRYHG
jgi:hypothetical protein